MTTSTASMSWTHSGTHETGVYFLHTAALLLYSRARSPDRRTNKGGGTSSRSVKWNNFRRAFGILLQQQARGNEGGGCQHEHACSNMCKASPIGGDASCPWSTNPLRLEVLRKKTARCCGNMMQQTAICLLEVCAMKAPNTVPVRPPSPQARQRARIRVMLLTVRPTLGGTTTGSRPKPAGGRQKDTCTTGTPTQSVGTLLCGSLVPFRENHCCNRLSLSPRDVEICAKRVLHLHPRRILLRLVSSASTHRSTLCTMDLNRIFMPEQIEVSTGEPPPLPVLSAE